MTSSPLFTSVAESMVIFCPIAQFGCFSASSGCTFSSSFLVFPRNGPPEAVNRIRLTCFPFSPFNAWKTALCSLSTGRIRTFFSFASGMMICPAVTRVSLFARAISFPASIAAIVGLIPIIPTIAVTRMSVSGITETSISPSMPLTIRTSKSRTRTLKSFAASSLASAASFG